MFRIVGTITLIAAMAGGYFLTKASTTVDRPSKLNARSENVGPRELSNEVLLAAIDDVGRGLQRLGDRIARLEDSQSPQKGESEKHHQPDEIELFDQAMDERAAAIAKTVEYDRFLELESRDVVWAEESEQRIQTAFDQGKFVGTEIRDIECRTTFCRVDARHEDQSGFSSFELIKRQIPGSYVIQQVEDDENGKPRTLAYFVREGQEKNNAIFRELLGGK